MRYNAVPAVVVNVESGHIKGPGKDHFMSVETESIAEIADEQKEDDTRNVIVISFDNLVKKAKNEASIEPLGLKIEDVRNLTRDLLIHLACAGDDVAKFLLAQLHMVMHHDHDEEESGGEEE